ncbi:hypothetical protein P0082_04690 [Candidatus Haliotispira prima]|uniref:DUF3570 domain-containing protein n=1 Tax=Candidatus Haliotispira prima TaxID=3034016 RepID=A0ABY8MLV7_9SPIO|nr:hypothetical protein P0082_04690 [Candidatus Haliotispira prima]
MKYRHRINFCRRNIGHILPILLFVSFWQPGGPITLNAQEDFDASSSASLSSDGGYGANNKAGLQNYDDRVEGLDNDDGYVSGSINLNSRAEGNLRVAGPETERGTTNSLAQADVRFQATLGQIGGLSVGLGARWDQTLDGPNADSYDTQAGGTYALDRGASGEAYAYLGHGYIWFRMLRALGIEATKDRFDIMFRAGAFSAGTSNAQSGASDSYLQRPDFISKTTTFTTQLDFEISPYVTVRGLAAWYEWGSGYNRRSANRTASEEFGLKDWSAGVLLNTRDLSKTHQLSASLNYTMDADDNQDQSLSRVVAFDQLGSNIGYQLNVEDFTMALFYNQILSAVLHRPQGSFAAPVYSYSAGMELGYGDYIGLFIDLQGNNWASVPGRFTADKFRSTMFSHLLVKVNSRFLSPILGRNTELWLATSFNFQEEHFRKRSSIMDGIEFGLLHNVIEYGTLDIAVKLGFTLLFSNGTDITNYRYNGYASESILNPAGLFLGLAAGGSLL